MNLEQSLQAIKTDLGKKEEILNALKKIYPHLSYLSETQILTYFKVESTPKARAVQTHEFNGRIVGSLSNILGQANLASGSFRLSVNTSSKYAQIVIVSDSYLPCVLQSAEYEGFLTQRTSRI